MTKRLTILPALLLWTAAASAAGYEVRMNGAAQQVEPFKHYHYVTCAPEGASSLRSTGARYASGSRRRASTSCG